jgi:putative membrane protein
MWRDGPDWGMMGGWGGIGPFNMIIWLVLLVLVVAAVAWLMRSYAGPSDGRLAARSSTALAVLEERYARGEINREEYLQKKSDIVS